MNDRAELGRYLTDLDVESITGVARATLSKMRLRGDGPPFVKIGVSVRYPEDSLSEWMAAHRRRTVTREPIAFAAAAGGAR